MIKPHLNNIRLENANERDMSAFRKIEGWRTCLIYYSTSSKCIDFALLGIGYTTK